MDSASAAVAEMVRVAAPGARVVAVDSDWEMIALETGPAGGELNERVLAAAKAVALKEPRIGRRLYGLFRAAGLEEVKVKVLAGADTTGRTLPALRASFARYALDSGRIAASEIEQWLAQIDRAIESGTFLFMLPQFVASGTRGGSGGLGR